MHTPANDTAGQLTAPEQLAIEVVDNVLEHLQMALDEGAPVHEALPMILRVALWEAITAGDARTLFVHLGEVLAEDLPDALYEDLERAMYFGYVRETLRQIREERREPEAPT